MRQARAIVERRQEQDRLQYRIKLAADRAILAVRTGSGPAPIVVVGLIGLARGHIAARRLDDLVDVAREHGRIVRVAGGVRKRGLNRRPVVDVDAVADQCPHAVGKVEVDVVHRGFCSYQPAAPPAALSAAVPASVISYSMSCMLGDCDERLI